MSFDRSEISIGRSPQADCRLVGDMISRLAIRIVVTEEELTLEDVRARECASRSSRARK
jgi:pSer/pThr/pTyr-binding forkhead associated (FHA) protein